MDELKEKALAYHCMDGKPGKIQVIPSKPCATANDLSLAYTPGCQACFGNSGESAKRL